MKNKVVNLDKKRNGDYYFIPFAIIVLLLGILCGYFLVKAIIDLFNKEPSVTEVQYKTLLDVLNNKIDTTKVVDHESIDSVTTFKYDSDKFYIAGYNDTTVYELEIDIPNDLSELEAVKYVIDTNVSTLTTSITRYDKVEPTSFIDTYGSGVIGKYCMGHKGSITKTFATFKLSDTDNSIKVINGDISTPDTYNTSDDLYLLYRYTIYQ